MKKNIILTIIIIIIGIISFNMIKIFAEDNIDEILLYVLNDRTGEDFDNAFIAQANQKCNVTISEYDQFVYFEFVPKYSIIYNFYSTGNLDTHGYLYNNDKLQLKNDGNSGDRDNFNISYDLIAGETYYLAVKCNSQCGDFAVHIEESVDYIINEITINDMLGNNLPQIPQGNFLTTVSITNVKSNEEPVIVLVMFTATGAFKTLSHLNAENISIGSTINISVPVDNTDSDVAKIKVFCWKSFDSMIPMGNSKCFPIE